MHSAKTEHFFRGLHQDPTRNLVHEVTASSHRPARGRDVRRGSLKRVASGARRVNEVFADALPGRLRRAQAAMALGALALMCGCGKSRSVDPGAGVDNRAAGPSSSVDSNAGASTGLGGAQGACGGFAGLPLAESLPLLQDRLRVALPASARLEPRGRAIMGAHVDEAQESRVVLDNGEAQLLVMAWELAASTGDGWTSQMASKAPPGTDVRERQSDAGLTIATLQTPELDTSTEVVEVLQAWVGHPDGTVQAMAFYVNPFAAASGAEACRDLPLRALASLRAGERALQRGGSWRLPTGPAGEVLAIDLPGDWTAFTEFGPDFFVHRLVNVAPIFTDRVSGFAYFGGHPSVQIPPDAVEEPGTLYGSSVTWGRWTEKGRVVLEVATAVGGPTEWTYDMGDDGTMTVPRSAWYTHVQLTAPDVEGLHEIQAALSTARRE